MTSAPKTPVSKTSQSKTTATKNKPARKSPAKKTATKKTSSAPSGDAPSSSTTKAAGTTGAPNPPPAAPPSRGGGVTLLAAVLILIGVGWVTYPQWKPMLDDVLDTASAVTAPEPAAPVAPAEKAAPDTPPASTVAATPDAEEETPPTSTASTEAAPAAAEPEETEAPASTLPPVAAASAPADAFARAMEELTEKIEALDRRIAALEAAPKPAPMDVQPLVAPLTEKITALESSLGAVDRLNARLQSLEDDKAKPAQTVSPLSFAVTSLSAALRTSQPFDAPLAVVAPLALTNKPLRDALDTLVPFADAGVPTLEQLSRSFATVAAEAARVRPVLAGDSWWEKALNRVAGLVSVRKMTADGAPPVDAALVAAETALQAGDLDAALTVLDALDGPSADAVAPWVASAKARLEVDAVLTVLPGLTVQAMAAPNATAE